MESTCLLRWVTSSRLAEAAHPAGLSPSVTQLICRTTHRCGCLCVCARLCLSHTQPVQSGKYSTGSSPRASGMQRHLERNYCRDPPQTRAAVIGSPSVGVASVMLLRTVSKRTLNHSEGHHHVQHVQHVHQKRTTGRETCDLLTSL